MMATVLGLGLGLSGCTPYVTVPVPENYRGPHPMRVAPVPQIVVESLDYATDRYGIDEPYAIEVPEGATEITWIEISRRLEEPAIRASEMGDVLPVYDLERIQVRAARATVEILLPEIAVPDDRTLLELMLTKEGISTWIVTNHKRTYPTPASLPSIVEQ